MPQPFLRWAGSKKRITERSKTVLVDGLFVLVELFAGSGLPVLYTLTSEGVTCRYQRGINDNISTGERRSSL